MKLYKDGVETTLKPGENVRTVFPLESVSTAVGEPTAMASFTLFTPAVMANVPDDEPIERWRV